MIPFVLNNALLITPCKPILFLDHHGCRRRELSSNQEHGLTPGLSRAALFSNKFLLGRWLGPSSVLGCWWPSSRREGLRKALFRLSLPWPTAGQLQGVTAPYYTASDVFKAAQHTGIRVPGQRGGWSPGWSPQSSVRTESRSRPPRVSVT